MPQANLDTTDLRILRELQRNGRLSNVELAERVGLSPSPCLARVKALERSGVINRYVALVDPEALGLEMSVFIQVKLERQVDHALSAFEQAINAMPEIMECHLMTGESDYLLRALVPGVGALQVLIVDRISRIPGVANIQSSFSLKQVKYSTAVPI